jgi:dimethylargininase
MRFTNAIVRLPGENFSEGLTTSRSASAPDIRKALEQHAAYCAALEACGVEVTVMPADDQYPDGTFVEDTFIVAARVAIATRPGAESRRGEVASVATTLRRLRPRLEHIESPGTLDGGDICQVDEHFLIGLSARTNEAGAAQLAAILARHQYTSSTVDIREASLLHLKSGIAYLGERRFLVAPELPEIREIADHGKIRVSAIDTYAANCVRVNDSLLIAADHPLVTVMLRELGYRTQSLEMSEFRKMDGGLSCLSLRF